MHHQIGAQLERPLEIGRGEGVIDDQECACAVCLFRHSRDIDDLQERVGRRFDPDQLGGLRENRFEAFRAGILGVTRHKPPRFENALEEAKCATVEIGSRNHFIAGVQG